MLDQLRASLTWFTQQQREDYAMLVACDDGDVPLVLSALGGFDQADPERMYLTFAHEARTPRGYVDVMVELLRMRVEVIDAARAERGDPSFPPVPARGLDGELPASERIQALLAWWRSGQPDPTQVVVVAFVPTAIPSAEVYAEVVLPLLLGDATERWVRHMRLLVRDRRGEPILGPTVVERNAGNVLSTTVDFSPAACEQGLAADASNTDLDDNARGIALLHMAAMDFAQRRYAEAIRKYGQLVELFQRLGDRACVALCLVGCGDVLRQVERYDDARTRYAQGVRVATEVDAKPVVLNGLIGLAQASAAEEEWAAAETAWDGAARVAGAMRMELPIADFVEQVGVARLHQDDVKGAWVVWERVLEYLEEDERSDPYRAREVSVLERMSALAQKQGWAALGQQSQRRLAMARHRLQAEGGA